MIPHSTSFQASNTMLTQQSNPQVNFNHSTNSGGLHLSISEHYGQMATEILNLQQKIRDLEQQMTFSPSSNRPSVNLNNMLPDSHENTHPSIIGKTLLSGTQNSFLNASCASLHASSNLQT